jgi:hypothetical protein
MDGRAQGVEVEALLPIHQPSSREKGIIHVAASFASNSTGQQARARLPACLPASSRQFNQAVDI